MQYLTPLVPPLAPFLDRMISSDIPYRYSAAEALKAFTAIMENLTPKRLSVPVPLPPHRDSNIPWQSQDRWAGLPEAFVRKHARVRPPVKPRRKVQLFDGSSYFVDWDTPWRG